MLGLNHHALLLFKLSPVWRPGFRREIGVQIGEARNGEQLLPRVSQHLTSGFIHVIQTGVLAQPVDSRRPPMHRELRQAQLVAQARSLERHGALFSQRAIQINAALIKEPRLFGRHR